MQRDKQTWTKNPFTYDIIRTCNRLDIYTWLRQHWNLQLSLLYNLASQLIMPSEMKQTGEDKRGILTPCYVSDVGGAGVCVLILLRSSSKTFMLSASKPPANCRTVKGKFLILNSILPANTHIIYILSLDSYVPGEPGKRI